MSSFLIARLPSQSKSLYAVEFMQRNAVSFRLSSNFALLQLLMSSNSVDSQLSLELSDELKPGDEEKHVIGQMTNIFDVKKEVKEEVDEETIAVQLTNSSEFKRIVEEYEEKLKIFQEEKEKELEELKRRIEKLERELEMRKRDVNDVLIARDEVEKNLKEAQEQLTKKISLPRQTMSVGARPAESEEVLQESAMEPVHDEDLLESDAPLLNQVPNEEYPLADVDAVDDLHASGGDDAINVSMESGITEPFDKMDTVDDKNVEAIAENMDDTLLMAPQGNDFADSLDLDESSIREEVSESQNLVENGSDLEEEMEEEEEQLEKESEDGEENSEDEKGDSDEDDQDRNTKQNVQKKRRGRPPGNTAVHRLLFSCPIKNCPSSFHTFEELKEHVKNHSGKEKNSCDVCKKDFPSVLQAMEHMKKREKLKCCGCGKRCSTKQHLVEHHRVHTKEKPYGCLQCGERFSFKTSFKTHMMKHNGVKPFSCDICKKHFSQKCVLDHHKHIHTKEKPFVCRQCKKRFTQKISLKHHEMKHTGEKPFECEECGQRFSRKFTLQTHMRQHTGERPFSCEKCDAKFTQRPHLNGHMKNKHP